MGFNSGFKGLSSVRRPFICIGGSSSSVCVMYVVTSLNGFPLFILTDSRKLVKTECVTGVWEALRVGKVICTCHHIHGISIFLFRATAPIGPGPPHSRGF